MTSRVISTDYVKLLDAIVAALPPQPLIAMPEAALIEVANYCDRAPREHTDAVLAACALGGIEAALAIVRAR